MTDELERQRQLKRLRVGLATAAAAAFLATGGAVYQGCRHANYPELVQRADNFDALCAFVGKTLETRKQIADAAAQPEQAWEAAQLVDEDLHFLQLCVPTIWPQISACARDRGCAIGALQPLLPRYPQ